MYCRKCGNELNDGMLFCPRCGNSTANLIPRTEKVSANKNRTDSIFSLVASLLPFLMFFIPLQVTTGSIWAEGYYLIIDGYDSFLQRDMLSIWWGSESSVISIINIVILFVSFVFIIPNIFATIKGTNNKTLHNVSGFLSAFFSLLYCMEGIILVVLCDSSYQPITFSYFAIILVFFIIVAQLFSKKITR